MTDNFYRSFMTQPYNPGIIAQTGRGRRYGGKITRFGSTLSGNANIRVWRGSPTGGVEGQHINPKFFDKYKLGGRRRRANRRRGRGGDLTGEFINPNTHYHTYPMIGSMIY